MLSRTDELDSFKRNVNLADLAASYGFQRNAAKSTKHTLSLEDEQGKHLVVSVNPDTGHWRWFDPHNEANAGTVVDFVQMMEQVSIGEVRKLLRQWSNTPGPGLSDAPKPQPPKKDRGVVQDYVRRFSNAQSSAYARSRGISDATLNAGLFEGRVLNGFNGALVFPHYDDRGICGYEIKAQGFTSFSSKGTKSLWVSRVPRSVRSIVVAESGIEALSYYQTRQPAFAVMVSPAGNWSVEVGERLRRLMQRFPDAEVVGAFNNDKGGHRQSDRLQELVQDTGNPYRKDLPPRPGADWNDTINDHFGAPKCGNMESNNG